MSRDHRHPLRAVQDGLAALVGLTPADRHATLEAMLRRSAGDAVGYWLQLVLAVAIATLGLALGSTAVVIGAMLISPLMQPIVELGIGLAVGSPLLTLRAGVRSIGSVVVSVLGAAAIARALPFFELTAELAARTSPTMLDLFIAGCCALAAVYTTVRSSRDTVSAAAGTAIGIALVPPLCTAGYGLGFGSEPMLRGAMLLFTANFSAIITVTAISVLALGHGQVDTNRIEDEVLATPGNGGLARSAARLARRVFAGRLGVTTRLVFPILLLAAIFFPLQRALSEVSRAVEVRSTVDDILETVPNVVERSVEVRGTAVSLRIFLIGSPAGASELEADLRRRIEAATGRAPHVEVIAVADASAVDAVAARLATRPAPPPPPPPPAPPPPSARGFAGDLRAAIDARWPAAIAGRALDVQVALDEGGAARIAIVHLGAPLGPAAEALLAERLAEDLGVPVTVVDRALPAVALEAVPAAGAAWLADALPPLVDGAATPGVHVCVTVPPDPPRRRPDPVAAAIRATLTELAATRPAIAIARADRWTLLLTTEPCTTSP